MGGRNFPMLFGEPNEGFIARDVRRHVGRCSASGRGFLRHAWISSTECTVSYVLYSTDQCCTTIQYIRCLAQINGCLPLTDQPAPATPKDVSDFVQY